MPLLKNISNCGRSVRSAVKEKRELHGLGSFAIDHDGDSIHSGIHCLTRPLQIPTLRHGLA